MRKLILTVLIVIFIVPMGFAEEKDISVLIFGGLNAPNKPDIFTRYRSTGMGFGVGVSFKGPSGLELIPRAAYRFFPIKEAEYLEYLGYPDDGWTDLSGGKFRVWEVFFELKFGFSEFGSKSPRLYATTGLGLAHTSYADGKIRSESDLDVIDMGISDIDIMMHLLGAGIEVPVSRRHYLFIEAGYMMIIGEPENTYYIPIQAGLAIRME